MLEELAPAPQDRTDNVRILFDEKQFRLQFSKTLVPIDSTDAEPITRDVFTAYSTPHYARDLMAGLKKAIEEYEKKHGPILSPADMQKKLRAEKEASAKLAAQKQKMLQAFIVVCALGGAFIWWLLATQRAPAPHYNAPIINTPRGR